MAVIPTVLTMRGIILRNDKHYRAGNKKKQKFLVAQRAKDDPYGAGEWEFPGGKVEPGETGEQGWVNECRQETGLLTTKIHALVWTYTRRGKNPNDPPGLLYLAEFRLALKIGGKLVKSHEHEDLCWLTFDEFIERKPLIESWEAATMFRSVNLL
jgi:8-oxo-dGTP diphosphatase